MRELIDSYLDELIAIRRDLHKHPELGFEETRTAGIVSEKLDGWGMEVHTGLAETGVVGTLAAGSPGKSLALRADMDALPLQETNTFDHRSVNDGIMHACGHDGHTAMLLGAARYLAETRNFTGTVHFIFQPAEEGGGGGRVMVEEGLFDRFPADAVYGLHNRSDQEAGFFGMRTGSIMAATDNFEIVVKGKGTHAAMPHKGIDPIVTASEIVSALQSIVARNVPPLQSAVISTTQFNSGTTWNIIPETAILRGCVRTRLPDVRDHIQLAMERVISGVCVAHGAGYEFSFISGYPPTVNTRREMEACARAAIKVAGPDRVDSDTPPLMASEDFSYYLERVPGCYAFLGNGKQSVTHRADYDFNDEIIPVGVQYWATLVEQELGSD